LSGANGAPATSIRRGLRSLIFLCFFVRDYSSEAELLRRLKKRGETSGRSDDNENTILKRFTSFRLRTVPVIDLYRNSGKLKIVDGAKEIEEVSRQTFNVIRAVEKRQVAEELGSSDTW